MTLGDYLTSNGLTETAFAQQLGVSQVTINRYVHDKRFPDREMIQRIAALTGGAVSPADWFDAVGSAPEAAQ